MSDPLDPTTAILGGFVDAIKHLVSAVLITAGAVVLGLNFHSVPKYIATVRGNPVNAVPWFFGEWPPFDWTEMMSQSMSIWYLIPLLLIYVWLIGGLWRGDEMFGRLLWVVVVHSVHTFLYTQQTNPLTSNDLVLAGSILVVGEIALVCLLLWWRHIRLKAALSASIE